MQDRSTGGQPGSNAPGSVGGGPLLAGLLAVVVLAGGLVPAATSGDAASRSAIPELPAEGHAVYEANATSLEDPITIRLNLTPEPVPCRDGFGVQRDCVRGLFASEGRLLGPDPIAFSPDHAEVVVEGTWEPPNRSSPSYAGPYPSWEGYPVPFLSDGEAGFGLTERMVVVAVTAQARADAGTDRTTTFAGHPTHLTGRVPANGTPTVAVEASLPDSREADATYRYEASFDGSAAFPTEITVVDLANPDAPLARARLVNHSASAETIDTDGWTPLPFPDHREGVGVEPWEEAPPSGDTGLFLPLDHANQLAQLTPTAIQENATEDQEYLLEAFYTQKIHHTDEPLQPNEIGGGWELTYGDAELEDTRGVGVARTAPNDTRDAFTEGINEFGRREPILHDDYAPAQQALPDELVTVGDAVEIGRSVLPIPADEVEVIWLPALDPDQLGSASAGVYIVSCLRTDALDVIASVSAVNGQLLGRGTLFGPVVCHPPP